MEWHPGLAALLEGEATVYRGREEVREMFQDYFEAFADLRFEISEIRDLAIESSPWARCVAWHGKWCRDRVAVGLPHPSQERQGNSRSDLPRSQGGPGSRRAAGVGGRHFLGAVPRLTVPLTGARQDCCFAWKAAVEREINGIIKLADLVAE